MNLHDHHIHLLATAAARESVDVSNGLDALRAVPGDGWIRAIGGREVDRATLDAFVSDRPVRVQHRSGARWFFNTPAMDELGLHVDFLHRQDARLRHLLPRAAPDLAALGAELASYGVVAVTDTTPYTDIADLQPLADAVASGALPQRVIVTGGPELAGADPPPGLEWGPVKIVIDDARYPSLDDLTAKFEIAHRNDRNVAVHCVTRTSLALAIAAWDSTGVRPGDRVEHAAVVPPDLLDGLKRHELIVVTQPGFIAERGDGYLRDVDPEDLPYLYPCRTLLDAGITVLGSTDAPYSSPNPRQAIEAAVSRTTRSGQVLSAHEAVDRDTAMAMFAAT